MQINFKKILNKNYPDNDFDFEKYVFQLSKFNKIDEDL